MANIKLLDISGKEIKDIAIDASLLVEKPHKQAMFDAVLIENASQRQGTHSTLTKGEVRGGGKKPWRQKHTGRARTGSTRNPHWTGGGVAFGPKPNRNYILKMNAKVRKLAFKSALTVKVNDTKLFALANDALLSKPSTKSMVSFLETANMKDTKVLVVLQSADNNIGISTNNIQKVTTKLWNQVSVRDILHANNVIIQEGVFDKYKEQLN